MKTSDFIATLTADQVVARPVGSTLAMAVSAGTLLTAALFALSLGVRSDIAAVSTEPRFLFKLVVTLSLVAFAGLSILPLLRPDGDIRPRGWLLAVAPGLLAAGVVVELAALPAVQWNASMVGSNGALCMTVIPLLSLAPLVALFVALRRAATTRPRLSGAIGGLLSSGIAASLYALHCNDDSPLFVALWYSLAIGAVTLLSTLAGSRMLRW